MDGEDAARGGEATAAMLADEESDDEADREVIAYGVLTTSSKAGENQRHAAGTVLTGEAQTGPPSAFALSPAYWLKPKGIKGEDWVKHELLLHHA